MFWFPALILGLVFGIIALMFRVAFRLLMIAFMPLLILLRVVTAGGSLLALLLVGMVIAGLAVLFGTLKRA